MCYGHAVPEEAKSDHDHRHTVPLTFAGSLVGPECKRGYGAVDDPPPADKMPVYRKKDPVSAIEIEEPFVVITPSGPQRAKAGDFLVRSADGDLWAVDHDQFLRTHERVDVFMEAISEAAEATAEAIAATDTEVAHAAISLGRALQAPVHDFLLYPLGSPEQVQRVLRTLVANGSIKRASLGGSNVYTVTLTWDVTCGKCGFEAKVPPEGIVCPNCARTQLQPPAAG